ncbi:MAG TPA: hypothetical protein VG318_09545 [Actinomycetota bacterium]|nr:hypothetical protein [Actinomycetota bacterium]
MKKAIVVALTAGLVAGALVGPADAGKKKKKPPVPPPAPVKVERVVEIEYQVPNLGVATDVTSGGICMLDTNNPGSCVNIPLQAGEAYVKIEVADTSGQKSYGFLSQGDTDGDGIGNLYGDFCGAHPEPIEMLSQSVPLQISLYNGAAGSCVPSVATTGTITATLSNIP